MRHKRADRAPSDCNFCQLKNWQEFSHLLLERKYSESFSFYFSKYVNEILNEVKSPAEIRYRDNCYYDDVREIMRRYYRYDESIVRLHNYTDYYAKLEDYLVPCVELLGARKVMFKRRKRKFKLNRRDNHNCQDTPNSQEFAVLERNQNFLRRLRNPTVYLEDLYLNSSTTDPAPRKTLETERLIRRSLAVQEPDAEIHDIYDPVFSSEDEKRSLSLEKALSAHSLEKDETDLRFPDNQLLDVSNESLKTRISVFERISESTIKLSRNENYNPVTQQTLLDIIVTTPPKEISNGKRSKRGISQRSLKACSDITKATFLNFKKKENLNREDYTSMGSMTKTIPDNGRQQNLLPSPQKKNHVLKLEVSPRNQVETTQVMNRCKSSNFFTPSGSSERLLKPFPKIIPKHNNKLFEKQALNSDQGLPQKSRSRGGKKGQKNNGTNGGKETTININFSTKLKQKLKQDSFVHKPLNCVTDKIVKPEVLSHVLNHQTSAQKELNYNLFSGAFSTEKPKVCLEAEQGTDPIYDTRQSNQLKKCPTDRFGKFMVKKNLEKQALDHTKTFVSTMAKNSVDNKPPVSLSSYIRTILQRSHRKQDKEPKQALSNVSKTDVFARLQFTNKPGSNQAKGEKPPLTTTFKELQSPDINSTKTKPQGKGHRFLSKDKFLSDKFYHTYYVNQMVKSPFSPVSLCKGSEKKSLLKEGFHVKALSRKENRVDEYNFYNDTPAKQSNKFLELNSKPLKSKSLRKKSSRNQAQRGESLNKNTKANSQRLYQALDGGKSLPGIIKPPQQLACGKEGLFNLKIFKPN